MSAFLANVSVASIQRFSDSEVVLVAASSVATSGDIQWTSETGSRVLLVDGTARATLPGGQWQYVTPAVISSVVPGIAQVNARVTINGLRLYGGEAEHSL